MVQDSADGLMDGNFSLSHHLPRYFKLVIRSTPALPLDQDEPKKDGKLVD